MKNKPKNLLDVYIKKYIQHYLSKRWEGQSIALNNGVSVKKSVMLQYNVNLFLDCSAADHEHLDRKGTRIPVANCLQVSIIRLS